MRAAVLTSPRSLTVEDRPTPAPGPEDVLIRVASCGVCGTDSHIYEGEFLVEFPVVPGHELSGTVVEVGQDVTHVGVGDRVTVDPNIVCGICRFCREGRVNLCQNLRAVGVNRDGGFAGYCVAPAKQVYLLPEGVSLEAGAFAEPLACCIHGMDRAALRPGEDVLIIGGGAIGQMMIQLCRSAGAGRILLSEPIARRREVGIASGASFVIDPLAEDVVAATRELTGGGADLVIECAGTARTAEQAVAAARNGGRVLLFGVAPERATANLRPYEIFIRELTVMGSFVNPFTHRRAVEALAAGRVRTETLITHRYPVAQLADALAMSRSRDAIKVAVQPADGEA